MTRLDGSGTGRDGAQWRSRGWWLLAVLLGLACVALSAHVAGAGPILARRWSLLAELSLWAGLGAALTALVWRLPGRRSVVVGAVLVVGIGVRVAALNGPPTTSDDLYRYAWDARVQAAGIDPYAEPPDSPVLATLREPWLWPEVAGCAGGCTRINRPSVRTIYPPAAEAWFALVGRTAGAGTDATKAGVVHRDKPWQLAGLATELVSLALLVEALRRYGRDIRWVSLYALSPAPALEFVNNGHVDGLAVVFILAAFIVAASPATRTPVPRARLAAAGALLGAAALVKVYPVVLLAGLAAVCQPPDSPTALSKTGQLRWLHTIGRRVRGLLPAILAAVGVVAAGYLPHVLRVGIRVVGYLPGYLEEEHYGDGGRFLLAGVLRLPGGLAAAVSLGLFVAVVGRTLYRHVDPGSAPALLLGALFLATTPVQPWYGSALLAIAALAGQWPWYAVVAAGYPTFFAVILDHPHRGAIGQLSYGLAFALVAIAVVIVPSRRARGLREDEGMDRAGPGLTQQPGDHGERPSGVADVIDEEHAALR